MARSTCTPCCDPNGFARSEPTYRASVLKILCEILTNTETEASAVDPLIQYKVSDLDEAGATKYYGFLDKDGNWYIIQLTATAARYFKGSTGTYIASWAARVGLAYNYFDVIF